MEIFIQEKFDRKVISYEVLSIFQCKQSELEGIAHELQIHPFDLSLDDSILNDYYLIRVRILNGRTTIDTPLRLKIQPGPSDIKILDIQHRIVQPKNKNIEMIDSISSFNWQWPENGIKITFGWKLPARGTIAGFNIYRSFLKDRGYGRVNSKLITTQEYSVEEETTKKSSSCLLQNHFHRYQRDGKRNV